MFAPGIRRSDGGRVWQAGRAPGRRLIPSFLALLFAPAGFAELPTAVDDGFEMRLGGKARVRVLDNDGGDVDPSTVQVTRFPAHGTVQVQPEGFLLYEHTAGSPTGDSLRYRVEGTTPGEFAEAEVTVTFTPAFRFPSDFSRLPSGPPTTTFVLVDAFPGISFALPHDVANIPGTNGILVTEAEGRVQIIPDTTAPVKALFLDITDRAHTTSLEQALKGIAVHPDWPGRPYIYVTYNTDPADGLDTASRLSRFTTTTTPPLTADPASELILIDQDMDNDPANNHTIGTPAFGADGDLYVSFGDEDVGQRDGGNNSQHVDRNLWSCLIRIDVDCKPGNLDPNPDPAFLDPDSEAPWSLAADQTNDGDLHVPRTGGGTGGPAHYKIPVDNPFVHTSLGGSWDGVFNGRSVAGGGGLRPLMLDEVRTEIYAVGLRNPWQHTPEDDDEDGTVDFVAVGDVGREARERIHFLEKGGNARWAWREGTRPGVRNGQNLNGTLLSTITNPAGPLWEYPHGGGALQGDSVIGGFIYRGDVYPSLTGKYIFADYDSGNIWSLERTGGAPRIERLAGETRITALGSDPATDEILFVDRDDGMIRRLVFGADEPGFPATLSATNFFADLADLSPNPGSVPYEINLRFWSDWAGKRRWFLLKNTTDLLGYSDTDHWSYPAGMVFAKLFDLELQRGNPASSRRLETRFLVISATGSYGVTYRWDHITDGQPQTEASLVGFDGEDLVLTVDDDNNAATPGIRQTWHFPSRTECVNCHNAAAGRALSFNTRQLNRMGTLLGVAGNNLTNLHTAGYLDRDPGPPALVPRHVRPDETKYSLEARLRSWLDVNCGYCHRGATGTAPPSWDGRLHLTLRETGLIGGAPSAPPLEPGHRLIVPGSVEESILKHRMAASGGYSRMPPLATSVIDAEAVELLTRFIEQEATALTSEEAWREHHFGDLLSAPGDPDADPDRDGKSNRWERLTNTNPNAAGDFWTPRFTADQAGPRVEFRGLGNRRVVIWRSTNLVDWFRWEVDCNDGTPLNPARLHTYGEEFRDAEAFFRVEIEEN